jgi:zinc protease
VTRTLGLSFLYPFTSNLNALMNMNIRTIVMIFLLTACASLNDPSVSAEPLARKAVLSNGLTILVAERNHLPTINLQVLLRAGSLLDPPEKKGLAGLTAALLPQGSTLRDAVQINRLIDSVGGAFFAAADSDYSAINLAILKKDLPLGLSILSEVLLSPAFAPEEMARKIAELKARLKRIEEDPRQVARLAFSRNLFGTHPYAYPPEGSSDGLSAISREDTTAFFKSYYRPNNATVIVVGQISLEETVRLLEEGLREWKPAPIPSPAPVQPPLLTEPVIKKIDRSITQANLVWGHLGISRSNPDFYALQAMNYILGGGGFVSRLLDTIRDNMGLTYGISSAFDARQNAGAFSITVETKNENANRSLEEIKKEIKKLLKQGVTETELEEAKAYLTGSFPLRMDSNAKLLNLLGAIDLYGLGLEYPDQYPRLINQVTAAEILRVARKYLNPDKFLLVVVGNQREIELKNTW